MDTHQWPEGIGVGAVKGASMEERKLAIRGQKPQAINCPRCNSSHTKFCYYNNYSLSQPRYFCKSCRRYWTEGGSLRNVPVGGGSRRNNNNNNNNNKRSSSSSSSSSKKLIITSDHHHQMIPIFSNNHHSKMIIEGQDLNLAYPSVPIGNNYNSALSQFVEDNRNNYQQHPNTTTTTTTTSSPAMEFFKINNNNASSRGFFTNSLMSLPISDSSNIYTSTLDFQDFKPTLNFGFEGGEFGNLQDQDHHNSGSGARVFFPYEDLKVSNSGTTQVEEGNNNNRGNVGDDSGNGYWSGSLGGGSW